jgi:parallel beta-helix repeat protein
MAALGGVVLEYGCEYNSFSSTSVINTSADEEAAGIALDYSNNNSFSDTSIINTSAGGAAAGIALGYSSNNSFHDTSISNVSANGLAAGIGLEFSDGNTFDVLTDVSHIHSYGLLVGSTSTFLAGSTTTVLTGYDGQLGGDLIVENVGQLAGNMACGIVLLDSNFSSFSDHTEVYYVMAENGEALGILLVGSFENIFSDRTEVSHIDALGGITAPLESANPLTAETATLDGLPSLDGNIACGIKLALSGNNTFNDRTDITYINATELACGIVLFILANDNEFYQCTISDLSSGSDDTTFGVFMLLSGYNLMSQAKIFRGGGPPLDFGVFLFWCSYNAIEDSDISDCYGGGSYPYLPAGIVITAEGIQQQPPCYNTIVRNRIHDNLIGILLKDEWENEIAGNTIEDNGEGIGVFGSDNNTIEGNMIRNNTGSVFTGVYVDENSDENEIHGNCFFYNEPYQAWDNFSGDSNHWGGNYWEPPPGESDNPFLIPGAAESRDGDPLGYCPMCAVQAPAVTPLGIAALVGLLAIVATSTMVMKRKKGR